MELNFIFETQESIKL